MNYAIYNFTKKGALLTVGEGLLISLLIAAVCYRSIFGMLIAVIVVPFWYKVRRKMKKQKQRYRMILLIMLLLMKRTMAKYYLKKLT